MDADADLTWQEVHRAMVPLMRANNRTNLRYLAREYALIALTLVACAALLDAWRNGRLGAAEFACLSLLGAAVVAALQHRLSALGHDASHYVLFKHPLANELAADLLCFFPLVAMTQRYRAAHLGHHRFVNDPARDPDLIRLNHPEPCRFPMSRGRFWWRYVVRSLWPPAVWPYLFGRAVAANLGDPSGRPLRGVYRTRVARCLRGAYWLSVFSVLQVTGNWTSFFLFWVVPLLTFYPYFMQLREVAHHSNAPDAGDWSNSRIFRVNPLLSFAVFPYGQRFHLTHHLFAMVPHYRLPLAHQILMRYPEYRQRVTQCHGYFFRAVGSPGPTVLEVISHPGHHVPPAHFHARRPSRQAARRGR